MSSMSSLSYSLCELEGWALGKDKRLNSSVHWQVKGHTWERVDTRTRIDMRLHGHKNLADYFNVIMIVLKNKMVSTQKRSHMKIYLKPSLSLSLSPYIYIYINTFTLLTPGYSNLFFLPYSHSSLSFNSYSSIPICSHISLFVGISIISASTFSSVFPSLSLSIYIYIFIRVCQVDQNTTGTI